MFENIPKHWKKKKIKELCDFQNGYAFNSNDYVNDGFPIIRMSNISVNGELNLNTNNTKFFPKENIDKVKQYFLKENDVIIAMTDMSKEMGIIGKTAIIDKSDIYLLNQRVGKFIIKDNKVLNYKYLHAYTNSPLFINYARQQCSGGVQLNLSTKAIMEHQLLLPTLEEQQEIVDVLDAASEIIRLRTACIESAQSLIPALFQEMFGDPINNNKNYPCESLKNLCSKIGSGATPRGGKESYLKEGISFVRSMNVHDGIFQYKDLAFINDEQAKLLDNVELQESDVLINITGASVARTCIVPKEILPARVNQHVSILRCTGRLNPYFLNVLLYFQTTKQKLLDLANSKGATREAITKQQLELFKIILPPIEQQELFAEKVQEIEAYIKTQHEELENAKAMFHSLLHHTFTGELTRHKFGGDANG